MYETWLWGRGPALSSMILPGGIWVQLQFLHTKRKCGAAEEKRGGGCRSDTSLPIIDKGPLPSLVRGPISLGRAFKQCLERRERRLIDCKSCTGCLLCLNVFTGLAKRSLQVWLKAWSSSVAL